MVTVRRGRRLMAAAALMRGNRLGLPVLSPIGAGISDFSDVLVDDQSAAQAGRHLARELTGGRHVLDLPEVPENAAVWQVAAAWTGRMWRMRSSTCLEIPARPLEEVIDALPRRSARTRLAKDRRIREAGITTRTVDSAGAADALATLLRLHRRQWQGRGMNPEHERPRFAAHLGRAVPAMVDRGQAVLVEYTRDDSPVAVELLLGGNTMMGAYLYGFQPELRERIDVAQLFLRENLELAQRHGAATLSLLRGDEPYKRRWRPREAHNERLLLASPGALPAPVYALGLRGRYRLADVIKSRSPRVATAVRAVRRRFPFSV